MKKKVNQAIALVTAFLFAFTGAFMFNGVGNVAYADVGSVSEGQEITYDKGGGVLGNLGIDTSQMPETYDPDNTSNPYGSDVTTMCEINELVVMNSVNAENGEKATSSLYGHDCKLDASYESLMDENKKKTASVDGPLKGGFTAGTDCDVSGAGRDSGAAIVYTNYHHYTSGDGPDHNIYMKIYNPKTGEATEPFTISSFIGSKVEMNYNVQSQLQIAAGDFDNDTVDEIAVYVPAVTENTLPRVAIYDLIKGKDCADPYNKAAWENVWNYVLPSCPGIVACEPATPGQHDWDYMKNFYNNIDLAAGDADNDGSCDLVVSYGASDVWMDGKDPRTILRSQPSQSVVLYGSNGDPVHGGQMLKDSQKLDYGGNELIRVSFAFGDLDDDGNEEMLMGGQLRSQQETNTSRMLGLYIYSEDSGGMVPECTQNMNVVDGQWQKVKDKQGEYQNVFTSANGWDGYYYSIPVMKTNIAVGNILGRSSKTRIYMDSVLYSFDDSFSIVDELEDASPIDSSDISKGLKGSAIFTDITGEGEAKYFQMDYFEYGASLANYTASPEDYLIVHRVSEERKGAAADKKILSDAAIVVPTEIDKKVRLTKENTHHNYNEFAKPEEGAPIAMFTADTDIDSAVAQYTGEHEITYQKPKVLAVLASAPYFQDVADSDDGTMIGNCQTTYGTISGDGKEYSETLEITAGVYTNNIIQFGAKTFGLVNLVGINIDAATGFQFTRERGNSVTREFEVNYGATAGENEVVLFSTPTENYTYKVTTGMVDDEGNVTTAVQTQVVADPHKPVTKTMSVEDYMEIQKRNPDTLPDVTKYITSEPGQPDTYPSGAYDLPKAVDESWKDVRFQQDGLKRVPASSGDPATKDDYVEYQKDAWEGVGFGNGFIEQSITNESEKFQRKGYGGYFELNVGAHMTAEAGEGVVTEYEGDVGLHFGVNGDIGVRYSDSQGTVCSGMVANMPESAKGYGYDFSWSLMKYLVHDSNDCTFPVITYMVADVLSPPKLPNSITQNFDKTTDAQTALTWTYSEEVPAFFEIYRYKDFPQGGRDELVGSVKGSDYRIRKDSDGNTMLDANNRPIREYTFIEDGLSPDTEYDYRMKVKRSKQPGESIFSPVIRARTDVSVKPDLKLSADRLTIYPDEQHQLKVELADPQDYEKAIDYQWQKYSAKDRQWKDLDGCDKLILQFTNCKKADEGQYRCRVNLVRKVDGAQYISAYTGICTVDYSMRNVKYGPINVFAGKGDPNIPTHTGLSVAVRNASSTGTARPTGRVTFTLEGPNGVLNLKAPIDEQTGEARIESIEDQLSTLSQQAFVNGGYLITASYEGDNVFYPQKDEEQYHYLRNIGECIWLSTESNYYFGEDILPTTHLYDYKKQDDGSIKRTDITDQIKTIKIFAADANGKKIGDAIGTFDLPQSKTVKIPLYETLKKRAYIEAYTAGSTEPAGHQVIKTVPMKAALSLSGKTSGSGDLLKFYSFDEKEGDVTITGNGSFEDEITKADNTKTKLKDLMIFNYYMDNGSRLCSSAETEQHKGDFVPARYRVTLEEKDDAALKLYSTFYDFNKPAAADFLVVGSYYEVTAVSADEGTGSVRMIAPVLLDDIDKAPFSGGAKLTLKAIPAKGFEIKSWKVQYGNDAPQYQNGGDLLIHTLRSTPTSGKDGEVSITATFEPKNNTLTYEAKGQGDLEVKPAFASGSTVLEGKELQFTATPKSGWQFREWRWENYGGSSSIAAGTPTDGGANTKTYIMGSSPAAVYAIFQRDTIDLDLKGDLVASYINNGENPLEDKGKEIELKKGKAAPMGARIRVKTAPGFELAKDAQWKVTIDGRQLPASEVEEFTSGGSDGCAFKLPDEVKSCTVEVQTEKGYYAVDLSGENVSYTVKVDGKDIPKEQQTEKLKQISAGTLVEVKALPARGKLFDHWTVDGEKQKATEPELSFTLMDNVSIEAAVTDDVGCTIKLTARGEGTGLCAIKDHNGEIHKETFTASDTEEKQVTAYKGESLSISMSEEDVDHTLTSVKMDGKSQNLTDGVFQLENVTANAEFICSFQPSTYYIVSFKNEVVGTKAEILDVDGRPLDSGETLPVGSGGSVKFSVVVDKNYPCHVRRGETELTADAQKEVGDNIEYSYTLTNVTGNTELTVDDSSIYAISDKDSLNNFIKDWNAHRVKGHPYAYLTKDIDMEGRSFMTKCVESFNGTLDGQGHRITGMKIGTDEEHCAQDLLEPCLFKTIGSNGCVKDLIIDDYQVYYNYDQNEPIGNALLAERNYGIVSGVTLKNCVICTQKTYSGEHPQQPKLAGLVARNMGQIQGCQVTGLKIYLNREFDSSNPEDYNPVGSAIALTNTVEGGADQDAGSIIGCYVEGLKIWIKKDGKGEYVDARSGLICGHDNGKTVRANYYRAASGAVDAKGTNVNTIASEDDQNKPAFAGNLAYHINKDAGQPLWGIRKTAETQTAGGMITPQIIPLDCGGEDCKAPVEADFATEKKNVALYLYPDSYKLPGKDSFGDDTPQFWQNGAVAYTPDYDSVEIKENTTFTGVGSLADCVAKLTIPQKGTTCYSDLKDALADTQAHAGQPLQLDIVGTCAMEDTAFTISEGTTMTICQGAVLTMKKSASIINNGTFSVKAGSKLHKYGAITSTGTITIEAKDNSFINYGSRLKSTGTFSQEDREKITCKPHCLEKWKAADQPNADGTWTRTATCDVCTCTVTEQIAPNPPAEQIESILLFKRPQQTFKAGDAFNTDGMIVCAELKNGGRAVITEYSMTITEDGAKESAPIKPGDELKKQGKMKIAVNYDGFSCGYEIRVNSAITAVAIADGKREVNKDATLQLTAILTPADKPANVTWTSSKESVATVDNNGLVTGHTGGQAEITVHADGLSDSCIITVYEAAESLELDQQQMGLMENSTGVLIASVSPGTADGDVRWTLPGTSVAGFYVKNETTGQMEVADSAVTKLSSNPQAKASAHVSLVGVGQGETMVTASIKDARGNLIEKTCKVEVTAAAARVTMLYENQPVSGSMRTVDTSAGTMQFTAESTEANDVLWWSVIDSDIEPDISVDDTGKVTLLHSGIASVCVTSGKTGAKAVCILKVTTRPQSIRLSEDSLNLERGEKKQLTASLLPADAEGSVRWESQNEGAALVSQNGVITAVGEGIATITATATADPAVTAACEVEVHEAEVALRLSKDTFYFNGKEQYPTVTVTKDGMTIAEGISESNDRVLLNYDGGRMLPGNYTVTATILDGGMQTMEADYRICIKPTAIKKLKKGQKSFTVQWKKQSDQCITGYQVRYSTKSNMSKSKKKTIKKYSTTKLTVKNLKQKKTYYVQVRTYKTINDKKHYSEWSPAKKVRTK